MLVLGISALYHDSAAAIIKDGEIIGAVQEERFTRKKHDPEIPYNAIRYCLEISGATMNELDAVVYYDNPLLTLDRYCDNLTREWRDNSDLLEHGIDGLLTKKIWVLDYLRNEFGESIGRENKLYYVKHHISHAASAFYPCPYENAAIITIDGVGEWATTSIGYGNGLNIALEKEIRYPHSIGLLYSAFTYYCGFKVNFGDYKLMGLAPYGRPIYMDLIKEKLIDIKPDGSFRLNMEYFDYQHGRAMINDKFESLFGGLRREPETLITSREMDMAASVQKVIEEVVIKMAAFAKEKYGNMTDNLVMAGGVALNCVANGVLRRKGIFKNIWIQPAAGDAGGALGAALYYTHSVKGIPRLRDGIHDVQKGSYLGPDYSDGIEQYLTEHGYPYTKLDKEKLFKKIAEYLDEQKIIGLFEGRMEFGPRALGNRSIIADPRSKDMQSKMNLKIKYRESFRPFAPSVLVERMSDYFVMQGESPYMLFCADVKESLRLEFNLNDSIRKSEEDLLFVINKPRSIIPAITHVDFSARVQTVSKEINPFFYGLIKAFEKRTGCGVIINTSFNVRGEPIVCTPEDAYRCFMRTEMEILVLGDCVLLKEEQPELIEKNDWRNEYELD